MKNQLSRIILTSCVFLLLSCVFPRASFAANSGPFTAELWVNPASSTASKAILGKAEEIRIFTDASGIPGCQFKVTTWQTAAAGSTALTLNTWNHVSCTYDKTSLKVSVNGIAGTAVSLTTAPDDTAAVWRIGQDDSASTTYTNFSGTVDDFNFYNYARTPKQIVSDMNAGHPAVGSPVGSAVAYWKFDEGQGTIANNSGSGGSSLNGTLTSMSSPATATSGWTNSGKFNKALVFDGSDDLISITDSSLISPTSQITLTAWVKPTVSASKAIAVKNSAYRIYTDANSKPNCQIYNASWQTTATSSTALTLDTWQQVTCTYDQVNTKIYLNGVSKGSSAVTAAINDSANALEIGKDNAGTYGYWSGSIDEVKIYNYALTADEVKLDYNQGAAMVLGALSSESSAGAGDQSGANRAYCVPGDATSCAAPVAEWNLDEGTGQYAYDNTGNANTGTLGTSSSPDSSDPSWSSGKFGRSLKFDGADDYVNVGSGTSLDITSDITVSAWIKGSGNTKHIFQKYTAGSPYLGYGLRIDTTGVVGFWSNSIGTWQTGLTAVNNNVWHFVAVTGTGTSGKIYVDGKQDSTFTYSAPSTNPTQVGYIGSLTGGSGFFNGLIDQVRIYNYARTPAQIAWDYNRGGPVGWWKFDECQGIVAHNSADLAAGGSSLDGTITIGATVPQDTAGTCSSGDTGDAWYNGRTGKYSSSMSFDGVDDKIAITDTANLRFDANTEDFSLFAWTKRTTTGAEYIISKEDADDDGYRLMFNSSNQVLCSEDATDVTSTSTITDTSWHLIGCTVDRDGNGQIYIDGKTNGSTAAMGTDAMATTASLTVGTRAYTAANYFAGLIDDVKIFNYALTATQIKELYNGGAVKFGN